MPSEAELERALLEEAIGDLNACVAAIETAAGEALDLLEVSAGTELPREEEGAAEGVSSAIGAPEDNISVLRALVRTLNGEGSPVTA